MFVLTQNRLALQYSVLLMIFLTLFITIVYLLVDAMVSFEQERQLQSNADLAAMVITESLRDHAITKQELDYLSTTQESGKPYFYYMVKPDGQLLFGDEFFHRLRPQFLQLVKGWNPGIREIRYESLVTPPPRVGGHRPPPGGRELVLMMTGRAIFQGDQLAGFFYTGRDVSFTFELTHNLLIVLVVLGILFLGIAMLLSFYMSKRAMIPIRRSFQRQREFAADASHELRTPLSILHSSLDVLEMEEGEKLSAFSRNVLVTMKDEVRRMTKLVSDLLTLARSDSGTPDLQMESFDVIPSVEQMVRSMQTLAQAKEIVLNMQAPAKAVMQGDPERFKQLLYILLDNAIKYTPNGGEVKLSLAVESADKHPCLRIVVQDTGIGIPPEEQDRIFDRFYRVDKNRSRDMGGTGLGLAIAKWIAEAHHGSIQVSSTPGKGSTFTVTIPINQPRTSRSPHSHSI
ncbi:sensor histidine kinase [Brevibacillus sp. SYP-B805]|nr:sensor histidine kinase [Brevibacillus sp. SYP-B805]